MTTPAVTVTFEHMTVTAHAGPLCDWVGGKHDARTERAAIRELRELERLYREFISGRTRSEDGQLERDAARSV